MTKVGEHWIVQGRDHKIPKKAVVMNQKIPPESNNDSDNNGNKS